MCCFFSLRIPRRNLHLGQKFSLSLRCTNVNDLSETWNILPLHGHQRRRNKIPKGLREAAEGAVFLRGLGKVERRLGCRLRQLGTSLRYRDGCRENELRRNGAWQNGGECVLRLLHGDLRLLGCSYCRAVGRLEDVVEWAMGWGWMSVHEAVLTF